MDCFAALAMPRWIDRHALAEQRRVGKGALFARRAHHLFEVESIGRHASAFAIRAAADKPLCVPNDADAVVID